MTLKMKKLNQGFTLIELLVVVAIIAILALIVLLALNPVEMARRSRDSRRLSDLGTLRRAIDLSLADNKTLTNKGWTTINTTTPVSNFDGSGLDISKYLSVVPQDPVNDGSDANLQVILGGAACTAGSTTKVAMVYEYSSDGNVYILRSRLESLDNCGAIRGDGLDDNYYEIGTAPGMVLPTPAP